MDLKSPGVFWPFHDGTFGPYPKLTEDIHCDVAVVGGGLSGVVIADALVTAGFEVVLLDKREIAGGSTSASTALVLYEIDTPLSRLIEQIGRKAAIRCYQLCRRAIDQLEQLIAKIKVPCEFERRQSLYLVCQPSAVSAMQREFALRRQAGFHLQFLGPHDLQERFSLSAPGALLTRDAAQFDPYQFTHQLVRFNQRKGLRVFVHTEMTQVEESARQIILMTQSGNRITARKWVLAAGYESQRWLPPRLVRLKSTYAMVTHPVAGFSGWQDQCLIWDTARPYFYVRTTRDHRFMIGGLDDACLNPAARDRRVPQKGRQLLLTLRRLYPGLHLDLASAWAGTFGETKDSLPFIGRHQGSRHGIYALCYGANGTNFALIAASLVEDLVRNRPNPDAALFALDR